MTNRNLTNGSQPGIDERVLTEFFTKAEALRNLDEAKDLRREIGERNLEGFLFPLTRVLDAIIEENSDLIEILSIEIRGVVEGIIAMLRRNFDWHWSAKGITAETREKFGYEEVYTLETNELIMNEEWTTIELPRPNLPPAGENAVWRFKPTHHPTETEVIGFIETDRPTAVFVAKLDTSYNLANFDAWRKCGAESAV